MNKIFVAALEDEVVNLNYFKLIGVGKINATYQIAKIINEFNPKEIINFGTAGALNSNLNGLIECTKFFQRDMDCRGLLDFKLGETPFDNIKDITLSNDGYSCGTGDNFVNNKIEMQVDVVDMEAYAIAKVCILNNIKFRCFKFISDNADKLANKDWNENLRLGAIKFEEFRINNLV